MVNKKNIAMCVIISGVAFSAMNIKGDSSSSSSSSGSKEGSCSKSCRDESKKENNDKKFELMDNFIPGIKGGKFDTLEEIKAHIDNPENRVTLKDFNDMAGVYHIVIKDGLIHISKKNCIVDTISKRLVVNVISQQDIEEFDEPLYFVSNVKCTIEEPPAE